MQLGCRFSSRTACLLLIPQPWENALVCALLNCEEKASPALITCDRCTVHSMLGQNPHWAKQYPTTVACHQLGQNKNTPAVRVTAHHTEDEPSKKIPAHNSCGTNTGRMSDPRRWMACSLLCCFGGCEGLSQRCLLLPICRSGVRWVPPAVPGCCWA